MTKKTPNTRNYKTCDVINENNTRDAIMKEKLNRDECDNDDVHKFLQLLKRPKGLNLDN